MSGLVNYQLINATRTIVIVTFAATLLFTTSYIARSRWNRDLAGWAVAGDRVALVVILALIGIRTFRTPIFGTTDVSLEIEDGCLLVTAIVSVAATVYLFRIQRKPRDSNRDHVKHHRKLQPCKFCKTRTGLYM